MFVAVNRYHTSSSGLPTQRPTGMPELVAFATVPVVAPAQAAPGAAGVRLIAAERLSLIGICANGALLNLSIDIAIIIIHERGFTHESKIIFMGTVLVARIPE